MAIIIPGTNPVYKANTPPLMKVVGISYVGNNPKIYGPSAAAMTVNVNLLYANGKASLLSTIYEEGGSVQMLQENSWVDLPKDDSGNPYLETQMVSQEYWSLTHLPQVNGNSADIDTEITTATSTSITNSQSATSMVAASVSASVGLSFWGVSASVDASYDTETDTSSSSEATATQDDSTATSIALPAKTALSVWEKRTAYYLEFINPTVQTLDKDGNATPFNLDQVRWEVISIQQYIDSATLDELPA
ncbi:MAG TPA: hypothetical protein DCE41_01320 [Cytophagales bacterium]|nr:hypothetical protein [Cytophagales bacterium]HAA18667.1 hypothetical protein [Cytophagales bacterium]HAP65113.1 hypothetical protein [Cytophagales bacterium]